MSHFGRYGPPDIVDTYSLLVLNVSFRTTADDLFPYFDKYGKVVDIFIPKDRRTGESRGFAFVRYHYQDEAQKAVERLDGKMVDGREIMVQFAKYGPNAEKISKGRIIEKVPRTSISRSRSPRRRSRDDYYGDRDYYRRSRSRSYDGYDRDRSRDDYYGDRDYYRRRSRSRSYDRSRDDYYGDRDYYRRRSRSRSYDRYDRDRYRERERGYRRRSLSRSASSDYDRGRSRGRYGDERRRSRSSSYESASPPRGRKSLSPHRSVSPDRRSPTSQSVSPRAWSFPSRQRMI